MASEIPVPEWLSEYCKRVQDALGLPEWQIEIEVSHAVGDNPYDVGQCHRVSSLASATLTFRWNIVNDTYWRETVIHEYLHVVDCHAEEHLHKVVFPETGQFCQDMARKSHEVHMETSVERLSRALQKLIPPIERDLVKEDGNQANNSRGAKKRTKVTDGNARSEQVPREHKGPCSLRTRVHQRRAAKGQVSHSRTGG